MSDWVIRLIEQSGYLGIAFLMFLETIFRRPGRRLQFLVGQLLYIRSLAYNPLHTIYPLPKSNLGRHTSDHGDRALTCPKRICFGCHEYGESALEAKVTVT